MSYASKDNTNLVVVTLNDGNDWNDHKELFEYGFNNYKNYTLIKEGNINIYEDTYYKNYTLYVKNNYNYLFRKNDTNNVLFKYQLTKNRNIKNGDIVGSLLIYIDDKKIHSEPIYVKEKVW